MLTTQVHNDNFELINNFVSFEGNGPHATVSNIRPTASDVHFDCLSNVPFYAFTECMANEIQSNTEI